VIVSGGASGLGAAVARRLVEAGSRPIVLDLQPPELEVPHLRVDLTDLDAATAAVQQACADHGGLDAVVTCAGIDVPGPFEDVPLASWHRVVAVNLLGTAAVVRAALPALRASRGRVITVSSTLGHRAVGDATAYCASKFAVVGFTRALAAEYKGRVGVTLLTPGGMDTAFFDGRDPQYQPGDRRGLADPAAMADAVLFALDMPPGMDVKELVVTAAGEPSWP
jgi:NAD(P)-dependent dehydrogenase (short-subunit alcohol dehydrogenase family)